MKSTGGTYSKASCLGTTHVSQKLEHLVQVWPHLLSRYGPELLTHLSVVRCVDELCGEWVIVGMIVVGM